MNKSRFFWVCGAVLAAVLAFGFMACNQPDVEGYSPPAGEDIKFTTTQVGGELDESSTTAIEFTFSASVTGLTAADIIVTGAEKDGSLEGSGTVWTLPVLITKDVGNIKVKITKDGIEKAEKTVPVFYVPGIDYEVEQVGGIEAVSTTSGIKFTFGSAVTGLTAADIIVTGTTATVSSNGELTGNNKDWTLPVRVTHSGDATVRIRKTGIDVGTKPVSVIYAGSGDFVYVTWIIGDDAEWAGYKDPTEIEKGDTLNEPPTKPAWSGHTFGGWYEDATYATSVSFPLTVNADMNIYAQWLEDIDYNAVQVGGTDGTVTSTGIQFTFKKALSSDISTALGAANVTIHNGTGEAGKQPSATFTLTSDNTWLLNGITVEKAGAVEVSITADGIVNTRKSVDIYKDASSSGGSWTVTLHLDGGTATYGTSFTVNDGQAFIKPSPDPTKANYSFGGWFTETGLQNEYNFSANVTAALDLYAKWNPQSPGSITVTFSAPDADTAYNESITVTPPTNTVGTLPTPPVRAGYSLAGWNTASNGKGRKFTEDTELTGNITVYAVWAKGTVIAYETFDAVEAKNYALNETLVNAIVGKFYVQELNGGVVTIVNDATGPNTVNRPVLRINNSGINRTLLLYQATQTVIDTAKKAYVSFSIKHSGAVNGVNIDATCNLTNGSGTYASTTLSLSSTTFDYSIKAGGNPATDPNIFVKITVNDNTWYDVELEIDYPSDQYSLRFNGGTTLGPFVQRWGVAGGVASGSKLGSVAWYVNQSGANLHLTNVKISYEE